MEWKTLLVDVLTGAGVVRSATVPTNMVMNSLTVPLWKKLKLDRSVTLTSSWAGLGSLRRIYLETLERRAVKKRKLQTPM